MKKIAIFDTAESSRNIGDYIINESIENEMSFLFDNNYITRYATHTPVINFYQRNFDNPHTKYCQEADYRFIQGTNLLSTNLLKRYTTWNINIFNYKPYVDSILIGCGMNPNSNKVNNYTKYIYKRVLSKNYIHSVRDERTKKFIESLGFRAINTGCPTLWSLTEEQCKKIPSKKSKNVIFTLTDYCRDIVNDKKMIDILMQNYEKVYFWIQGASDLDYFNEINNYSNIEIVAPNLKALKNIFLNGNIDYVGTRLHAGIYAMKNCIRSIILIVDNRARDMKNSYNLIAIERKEIHKLEGIINSEFNTEININTSLIEEWKSQFKEKKR